MTNVSLPFLVSITPLSCLCSLFSINSQLYSLIRHFREVNVGGGERGIDDKSKDKRMKTMKQRSEKLSGVKGESKEE